MIQRIILIAVVGIGVVVAATGLWIVRPLADASLSGRPATPLAASPLLLRDELLPLLEQASADAQTLVALGESRERNLLRIRAGQESMNGSLAATDAWLASHAPTASDHPAIAAYRNGAAAIREAMAEAQAGFLRFDFDRVGRTMETLEDGAAALEQAITLLEP